MCVNTSIFCVNERIFVFCKSSISFFYSGVCGSPVITLYTTSVSSAVFEIQNWLCYSSEDNAVRCCQCDLSSPRYIVTCTCTFRTQVSYSSVVEVCFVCSVCSVRVASLTAVHVHSFPSLVMAVFASKICWSLQQLAMI